jgi:hypothetical protein
MGHRGSRPAPGPRHRQCNSWVVSADRRPLVFLDVDGVLLPFGDGAWGGYGGSPDDGQLSRLDLGIGRRLAALECDLVGHYVGRARERRGHPADRVGNAARSYLVRADSRAGPRRRLVRPALEDPRNHNLGGGPTFHLGRRRDLGTRPRVGGCQLSRTALLYRVDPSCGLAFQDVDGLKMWLARA